MEPLASRKAPTHVPDPIRCECGHVQRNLLVSGKVTLISIARISATVALDELDPSDVHRDATGTAMLRSGFHWQRGEEVERVEDLDASDLELDARKGEATFYCEECNAELDAKTMVAAIDERLVAARAG